MSIAADKPTCLDHTGLWVPYRISNRESVKGKQRMFAFKLILKNKLGTHSPLTVCSGGLTPTTFIEIAVNVVVVSPGAQTEREYRYRPY